MISSPSSSSSGGTAAPLPPPSAAAAGDMLRLLPSCCCCWPMVAACRFSSRALSCSRLTGGGGGGGWRCLALHRHPVPQQHSRSSIIKTVAKDSAQQCREQRNRSSVTAPAVQPAGVHCARVGSTPHDCTACGKLASPLHPPPPTRCIHFIRSHARAATHLSLSCCCRVWSRSSRPLRGGASALKPLPMVQPTAASVGRSGRRW